MRIRFISGVTGSLYTFPAGLEIDHADEAQCVRWIKAGVAVPIKVRPAEAAVARAPEDTTLHLPRRGHYRRSANRRAG